MKFTPTILVMLAATYVIGAALPEAEPKGHLGFCGAPGASCARDATPAPVPEPQPEPKGHLGFCGAPGASCARDAAPEPKGHLGFCGAPGASCAKSRRAADAVAEAVAEAKGHLGFCGAPGASCAKARRHLESIGDALDDMIKRDAKGKLGFCGAPGASCARDAVAEAEAKGHLGFCGAPGASCARNALPEAKGHLGFCGAPGASCAKVRRAVDAINEAQPNYLRERCFEAGGECASILKARKAIDEVKREAAAHAAASPKGHLGFCGAPGASCAREVVEYLNLKTRNAEATKREAEACFGPGGACLAAEADFAALERSVDDAVAALAHI